MNLPYSTIKGGFLYIYNMVLGSSGDGSFYYGVHKTEYIILYTLFMMASFMIMIHLLNMLIVIMGNTQSELNE